MRPLAPVDALEREVETAAIGGEPQPGADRDIPLARLRAGVEQERQRGVTHPEPEREFALPGGIAVVLQAGGRDPWCSARPARPGATTPESATDQLRCTTAALSDHLRVGVYRSAPLSVVGSRAVPIECDAATTPAPVESRSDRQPAVVAEDRGDFEPRPRLPHHPERHAGRRIRQLRRLLRARDSRCLPSTAGWQGDSTRSGNGTPRRWRDDG